eukprot:4382833-Pyramimonas_sp.AAC.1
MGKFRSTGKQVCYLLDAVGRSHKQVRRSSFGPELLAARRAVDGLQAHLLTLHEAARGPASAEIRRLRAEGGYAMVAELVVESAPVFAALAMESVRPPSGEQHGWPP